MRKQHAFTLVELLTVIGIIAILMAILSPIMAASRAAAYQNSAMHALRQLHPALQMYSADADEQYMIPYYANTESGIAWYGAEVDGKVDERLGLLSPYVKSFGKDTTHQGLTYKGNGKGFGYNWGYLGSSAYVTEDPNAMIQPASTTVISDPSQTIAFATSVFYSAKWLGGDGNFYDYGYIDPVKVWHGAPTVDFRHMGVRKLELAGEALTSSGSAIVLMCDGSARTRKQTQVRQRNFER